MCGTSDVTVVAGQDRHVQPAPPTMPTLVQTRVLLVMPPMLSLLLLRMPPAMLQMVMQPMVPMMATGVRNAALSLGASLRDRTTLPSPLRGLGPFGRVSLAPPLPSVAAHFVCPAARCR